MNFSMIAAMDENRVIGKDNDCLGGYREIGSMYKRLRWEKPLF